MRHLAEALGELAEADLKRYLVGGPFAMKDVEYALLHGKKGRWYEKIKDAVVGKTIRAWNPPGWEPRELTSSEARKLKKALLVAVEDARSTGYKPSEAQGQARRVWKMFGQSPTKEFDANPGEASDELKSLVFRIAFPVLFPTKKDERKAAKLRQRVREALGIKDDEEPEKIRKSFRVGSRRAYWDFRVKTDKVEEIAKDFAKESWSGAGAKVVVKDVKRTLARIDSKGW